MDLKSDALKLDKEAAELASRMKSEFIAIGRVMAAICEYDRWRLLTDERTGQPYHSLESWVNARFRSQRATAFEARRIYRALHPNVPDEVLQKAEPGSLKLLAMLPESAQRSPKIQQLAASLSPGDFTKEALTSYPNELIEKKVRWILNPTLSQASGYDRVIEKVQRYYGEAGSLVSREEALEYLLRDCEEQMDESAVKEVVA